MFGHRHDINRLPCRPNRGIIRHELFAHAVVLAPKIGDGVARDTVKPGRKRGLALIGWQMGDHAEHNVARQIFRIMNMVHVAVDKAVQLGKMPVIQRRQSCMISGLGRRHQFFVWLDHEKCDFRRFGGLGSILLVEPSYTNRIAYVCLFCSFALTFHGFFGKRLGLTKVGNFGQNVVHPFRIRIRNSSQEALSMKLTRIALVAVTLLTVTTAAFAQDANKVVVDKSLLTPEQMAKVKAAQTVEQVTQVADQVQQVGKYAGLGKEVGEAVNGSLSAITDNANKFANTKVGTFTMWIVAFKVLGVQAIRLSLALIFMTVFTCVFLWIWGQNFIPRRILAEETEGPDKTKTRKYVLFPKDLDDRRNEYSFSIRNERTTYVVIYVILMLITLGLGGC